jgi:hypothetical protein
MIWSGSLGGQWERERRALILRWTSSAALAISSQQRLDGGVLVSGSLLTPERLAVGRWLNCQVDRGRWWPTLGRASPSRERAESRVAMQRPQILILPVAEAPTTRPGATPGNTVAVRLSPHIGTLTGTELVLCRSSGHKSRATIRAELATIYLLWVRQGRSATSTRRGRPIDRTTAPLPASTRRGS